MRLLLVAALSLSCGSSSTEKPCSSGSPVECACASWFACGSPLHPPEITRFDECVAFWSGSHPRFQPPGLIDRLARAGTDCAAAQRCYPTRGSCDPATAPATCEGATSIVCYFGTGLAIDCAGNGLACIAGLCNSPCTDSDCSGNQYGVCEDGGTIFTDCPAATICTAPGCMGSGAPCADTTGHCEGPDVAVNCIGRHEARETCAPGLTCRDARCVPACDGNAPVCDGAAIVYCGPSGEQRFDCAAAGFKACSAGRCTL